MMDSDESLRKWLCCLENCFAQLDRPAEAQRAAMLTASIDLNRPIKVVVVGEFNSGKSTLVNALCGMDVLPSGIIPTTATVNVVSYSPTASIQVNYTDGSSKDLAFSKDALQQFTARNGAQSQIREIRINTPNLSPNTVLVDTPGVNDINETRSEIVYGILPEADVVVFLMDIQQPLKRSEVDFLRFRILGTSMVKTIFVLNHIDRVSSAAEVSAAVEFVRDNIKAIYAEVANSFARAGADELASEIRNAAIPVFRVSAKRMLRSIPNAQPLDGDLDGLRSELINLISPESKLQTLLGSVGAQARCLASRLHREIGEQIAIQDKEREETFAGLARDTAGLRQTWESVQKALARIDSERTALREEAECAVNDVFRDASASVAARLGADGIERGSQFIQQEIARNLESRMLALNGRIQELAIECAQQAAFAAINCGAQNVRLGAPDPPGQRSDWIADMLSDPVKGAAFWVLAPAVPFVFGPIGFVLIALPFVARLFIGRSSDTSVEVIHSQLAKSSEEIQSQLCRSLNDRLDAISISVFDIFDELQGRILTSCGAIRGERGIDRAKLQSLKAAAATLQIELAETMTALTVDGPAQAGFLAGVVRRSTNQKLSTTW